jgi:aspartyl-tRNA(Asn)/glutamyl-tRNA(Gln) amidotransferase subunit A
VFLKGGLSAIELRSFLDRELPDWLGQLDPIMAPAVRGAEGVSAGEYLGRLGRLKSLAGRAAPRFDGIDVIATPTLCLTPPALADLSDADAYLRVNRRIVRNTVAVNYLGLCAITLPVGQDKAGMPVGLQLIAPSWAEEKLLSIALAAERVLGTAAERLGIPPLSRRDHQEPSMNLPQTGGCQCGKSATRSPRLCSPSAHAIVGIANG